jgi:hypothetical protein
MTSSVVAKKSLMKSPAVLALSADGVVSLNLSGVMSYFISSMVDSDLVCYFSGMGSGSTTYASLYALAHGVDSVNFP